jgi:hypothetical protein
MQERERTRNIHRTFETRKQAILFTSNRKYRDALIKVRSQGRFYYREGSIEKDNTEWISIFLDSLSFNNGKYYPLRITIRIKRKIEKLYSSCQKINLAYANWFSINEGIMLIIICLFALMVHCKRTGICKIILRQRKRNLTWIIPRNG